MTKPISDRERQLWQERIRAEAARKYTAQGKIKVVSAAYTVTSKEGTILIDTASAAAANITLPDPAKYKKMQVTILNYSGAAQNVLSHAGTTLKVANTAAVGTHSVENSSSATTGKRVFVIGKNTAGTYYWYIAA